MSEDIRGADAELGRRRQPARFFRMFFGEFFEDVGEDRDHEHHDRDQNDDGKAEDQ